MRRFILVASLVAVMLREAGMASVPQVSAKFKGEDWVSEQDTKEAWGARAVEPPEMDDRLEVLLPALKTPATNNAKEKLPGAQVWVEASDILSQLRKPSQGPEPDRDGLYHPRLEELPGEEAWPREALFLQMLQGPEEDHDHIYHPSGL